MNCQKHLTFFYLYNKLTNKHTGATANSSTKRITLTTLCIDYSNRSVRSMTQQMFKFMALPTVNMENCTNATTLHNFFVMKILIFIKKYFTKFFPKILFQSN